MRLEESTEIGAGVNLEEGETLLEDPRRRNEDRDSDEADRVSYPEESSDSVSEKG